VTNPPAMPESRKLPRGNAAPVLPPVFRLDASDESTKVDLLSRRPLIGYVRGVLTAAESRHLARHAAAATRGGARTMTMTEAGRYSGDRVLRSLQRRLVGLSGRPVEHFEPMTAVLCRRGQQLRPHWDAEEYPAELRTSGQSVISFFVHLTTLVVGDGGALTFPRLGLDVQPVAGDAVCWLNVTRSGRVLRKTLHLGGVVATDVEKWAINVWIRERPCP
jgi:2OG-Fe(II) oxygenase superfamily